MHPIDIHVGQKLRDKRIAKGLSQDQIAGRVGITFQQIQKYEKGLNRIGASRLFEFSQILGMKPGDFFEGMGEIQPIEEACDKNTLSFSQMFNKLTMKKKKFILHALRVLNDETD